jgi:hypothetical protein
LSKYYNKSAIKFREDILYITYILNLVVQDIIKGIIKNNYDISYIKDIYKKNKTKKQETNKLYF